MQDQLYSYEDSLLLKPSIKIIKTKTNNQFFEVTC